jgi:YesN/AraC family two-component response regulator
MPDSSIPDAASQIDALDIVVVDDEEMVLTVVGQIIEAHGHRVRTAFNSRQALDEMKTRVCDLLVTDIKMPGMSGLELARRVRTEYPDVRIVLMTGFAIEHSRQEAAKLGVDGYLRKPFKARELTELLDGVVQH